MFFITKYVVEFPGRVGDVLIMSPKPVTIITINDGITINFDRDYCWIVDH